MREGDGAKMWAGWWRAERQCLVSPGGDVGFTPGAVRTSGPGIVAGVRAVSSVFGSLSWWDQVMDGA